MAQTSDFEQLMAGVAAGKEDAVWELAETYTPYILRAVRASLPTQIRRRLDSQDFAQALWASLLLKSPDLSRLESPEQLIAFLARAARNKVISAMRQHISSARRSVTRERSLEQVAGQARANPRESQPQSLYAKDPSPSQFASIREQWKAIMSESSDRDRQILQLRMEGKTFDAIGHKLNINPITARRAIHRLIERLSQ